MSYAYGVLCLMLMASCGVLRCLMSYTYAYGVLWWLIRCTGLHIVPHFSYLMLSHGALSWRTVVRHM